MTQDTIERETVIAAPVERVWALITEPEHVGRWFGDAGAEIDLRPGGAMTIRWSGSGASRARVEVVEPPNRFAYRWAPYKDPGGVEVTEGNSTLVEFTLAAEGDGTRLTVRESGFATLATTDEVRAKNRGSNVEGWQRELNELAEYARKVAT